MRHLLDAEPFLLDDVAALRSDLLGLGPGDGRRFELWTMVRDSARRAPDEFGWFVPFVAVITRDPDDIDRARRIIDAYLGKLDAQSFSTGLQFHFWCFAFPHAKVALYFQWLCSVGAYSADEADAIGRRLVEFHFVNFYYGMRDKPEPECVDNQALSLVLSTTLLGHLFAGGEQPSRMAEIMRRDGLRRLPGMLAELPPSGYTGEGSDYMNCVVAPAIPLAVEVLERVGGYRDVLEEPLVEGGARPVAVLRMMARSFMPGGLLLPWDNYGYQFGVRSALAYGARRTGDDLYFQVLDREVIWTYDIGIGWAYDDLIWTLIWWPPSPPVDRDPSWRTWFEPEVGAAQSDDDGDHYVVQMWDESEPVHPTRAHVNPNAVLFSGFRVPISADGSPTEGAAHRFQFDDTWREVSFLAMNSTSRYNYGDGCAGAHSVVLLDGREGMRALEPGPQTAAAGRDEHGGVWADVTPIYRQNVGDVTEVSRHTRLHPGGIVTIVDRVVADREHRVTSRFVLRPGVEPVPGGARVRTPEGVTLHLVDADGATEVEISRAEHVPAKPDDGSVVVDFSSTGSAIERVLVGLISREFETDTPLGPAAVIPDPGGDLSLAAATAALRATDVRVPVALPAYLEADLPAVTRWWYRVEVDRAPGPRWLRLPVGMHDPRLFVDGVEIDLAAWRVSGELLAPRVPLPASPGDAARTEVVLALSVPRGHYDGEGWGTIGMTGGLGIGGPLDDERLVDVARTPHGLRVTTTRGTVDLDLHLGAGARS